jgi:hypothetical protein
MGGVIISCVFRRSRVITMGKPCWKLRALRTLGGHDGLRTEMADQAA